MKTLHTILLAIGLVVASCGGMRTTTTGLDNVGFVNVFGDPNRYPGGVMVSIDSGSPFIAEVISQSRAERKAELPSYKIPTGKRMLKVTYQSKVVYQRQISLFSQETYKINLP